MNGSVNKPLNVIVVGAGHRAMGCAEYALKHPEKMKVVGVAEPNDIRRNAARCLFKLPENACFKSAQQLADQPRLADAVINGTMDRDHIPTTIPLLRAGYNVLLEKPIGISRDEILELLRVARENKRTVMVCHVLRYAPFYKEMRKHVVDGTIGTIVNIQTAEHVSYHHMSVAYVRGKWNRKELCGSSMLMAKCCHDLDLLVWMKSGIPPESVSSMGSCMHFKAENAPEGSGNRCLADCQIEKNCTYSARKLYINHPDRWAPYVWSFIEHINNPTIDDKIKSLETDNPHGRCIWKCGNDVVDHQSVVIQFSDGATATHNMIGGTARPGRYLHLIGTKGEIQGCLEDGTFVVRRPDSRTGHEYAEEKTVLDVRGDMHGGGDEELVADFIRVLTGNKPSISTTFLEDSIYGHLAGFAADDAMQKSQVVTLDTL